MSNSRTTAAPLPMILVAIIAVMGLCVQPALGQLIGQVPINPKKIPQFVDPLPHFAGARVNATTATDVYVKAVPHTQVAVSTGTKLAAGATGSANVWVYQVSTTSATSGFTPPLWPAHTIEAKRGQALNVHYSNKLAGQRYSDVGLIVDRSLHAAEPLMQMPPPVPPAPWTTYTGPVPITVHLHGGEVGPASDGGPDSWFMPDNPGSPRGHSYVSDVYSYPNTQEAATLWFHDHVLGVTRLNVYAGMAGFYFLRDPNEHSLKLPGWKDPALATNSDGLVQECDPVTNQPTARAAYLPEIEIVIQDRMFDTNGKLYFPNLPPNPADHPYWTPEFVGDVITVNGKTWPYLSVAPRRYRFRFLNGSNARFYNLSFPKGGPTITQIGTDGGFLDAPLLLNGPLLLAPGERADVIVDFTPFTTVPKAKGKTTYPSFILNNDARTPFPGGAPVSGNTTGRIMKFVVNGQTVGTNLDVQASYASLKTNVRLTDFVGNPNAAIPAIAKTRQLTLNEVMGAGGPLEVLVNNTKYSGLNPQGVMANADFTGVTIGADTTYYSETVGEGTTEIWQIINLTADAHPIHLHLVQFQLMSRQPFDLKAYNGAYNAAFSGGLFLGGYGPPKSYNFYATNPNIPAAGAIYGGNPDVRPFLLPGTLRGANPNEQGWKDTFIMYPGEVTTVIARWAPTDKPATDQASSLFFPFDPNGGHGYVWHCHIIDHEDNEMMRPYNVTPSSGAPARKVGVSQSVAANKPTTFGLDQNYPNPFNPSTEIRFALPEDSRVQLKIFNALGQEVQTLIDADAPAGTHTVRLDAGKLASGVYFYRLQAGNYTAMKKMMLLK